MSTSDPAFKGAFSETVKAWNYRPDAGWMPELDIVGYQVEATDGAVGKIDQTSHAANDSYIVIDTGPWIFGKKIMIPAGMITNIDHQDRRVYLDLTKGQVKGWHESSDEYPEPGRADPDHELGGYEDTAYPAGPSDYHEPYPGSPPLGGNLMR